MQVLGGVLFFTLSGVILTSRCPGEKVIVSWKDIVAKRLFPAAPILQAANVRSRINSPSSVRFFQ